jgi:hypothetical protein
VLTFFLDKCHRYFFLSFGFWSRKQKERNEGTLAPCAVTKLVLFERNQGKDKILGRGHETKLVDDSSDNIGLPDKYRRPRFFL